MLLMVTRQRHDNIVLLSIVHAHAKWMEHLRTQHKARIDIIQLKFDDYNKFTLWKEEEEFKYAANIF
jgi:hypothetical protein